jgi:GNAT superfamily N-acetyltransferase
MRLMLALIDEALRRGAKRSTLEVRRSNVAAISLYERLGYRSAALRKAYYSDTKEDAVVMWADELEAGSAAERGALEGAPPYPEVGGASPPARRRGLGPDLYGQAAREGRAFRLPGFPRGEARAGGEDERNSRERKRGVVAHRRFP